MSQIDDAFDVFNKIKVVNLPRFDEFLFYDRKKKFLSNLRKNIKKFKYNDTKFLLINFPCQKCHISKLSRNVRNLNDVYSLFKSDPDLSQIILGDFKYINIINSNICDYVDINICTILHLPLNFFDAKKYEDDAEEKINSIWEFNRYYCGQSAYDKINGYDFSTISFQYLDNSSLRYLESFIHFYNLDNDYLNYKTLLSVSGTMRQMMI